MKQISAILLLVAAAVTHAQLVLPELSELGLSPQSSAADVRGAMQEQQQQMEERAAAEGREHLVEYKHTFTSSAIEGAGLRVNEPTICDDTVQQYSGYLDLSDNKHYFFWFFESRNDPANDPVILWLNGGPGCSSMMGLFFELGPCWINQTTLEPYRNDFSWNNNANIIFLDQPAGAGFSYGAFSEYATGSRDVGSDAWKFFQVFYETFPKYADLPLHVFGESYAGHYVPAIGSEILQRNAAGDGLPIQLESLGLANGLTDPLTQYPWFKQMACNSTYDFTLGETACNYMEATLPVCLRSIENCYEEMTVEACLGALIPCQYGQLIPYHPLSGQNPYDVRIPCEHGRLCYDLDYIHDFLMLPDVQSQIGVDRQWKDCNMVTNMFINFNGDWMMPYHTDVADALHEGVRVLVFAGDADYVCNWYGNKAWTIGLEWEHHDEMQRAPDETWAVNGESAGEVRTAESLTFLRMFEAGHMAPYDQPEWASHMIDAWIAGEPLYSSE